MKKTTWISLAALLLFFCTGCGTVASITNQDIETEFGVYSGLRADWELWNIGYRSEDAVMAGYQWMYDMPLSAVLDTIYLPITLSMLLIPKEDDAN